MVSIKIVFYIVVVQLRIFLHKQIHHKKGRKHLQPKITVDHIYNIMFGVDIIKNHEKEKDWKAAIKAMLKKKREMKLNAKSLYKKYGKKEQLMYHHRRQ